MRFPSSATLLRTFYALSNTTSRLFANPLQQNALSVIGRPPLRQITPPMPNFFSQLFGTSAPRDMSKFPVQKSDDEWKAQLSPQQFRVLRQQATEAPYTGKYDDHFKTGVYTCAGCDAPLYKADTKFKSHCGWPAYFDSIPGAVGRNVDNSGFMQRIEIVCNNCGGHLGHVFKGEKYPTPTDERHCVNSISLNFAPSDGEAKP